LFSSRDNFRITIKNDLNDKFNKVNLNDEADKAIKGNDASGKKESFPDAKNHVRKGYNRNHTQNKFSNFQSDGNNYHGKDNKSPYFERLLTRQEAKNLFENFPNFLDLIKQRDSVNKYKIISREIYKHHNDLKKVLKIDGFYRLYCYYRKFYVVLNFESKTKQVKNLKTTKPKRVNNKENMKILNSKVVNIYDSNNFVKTSNSIKRFILSLSSDFTSTIFLNDQESKKVEINKIINKLEMNGVLPDFLIKSKLHFDNGDFYSLDLLGEVDTDDRMNPINSDSGTKTEILSDDKRQRLLNSFPTISEIFFMESNETLETSINMELDNLRNSNKNNPLLKNIEFRNENFVNNSIKSLNINSLPQDESKENATDILFDFGEFDLLSLAENDADLKSLLALPNNSSRIVDTIFHINYLHLKNRLPSKNKLTNFDKAINYLRNCGTLYSVFSLDDASELETDEFEIWGKSIINALPKLSFFRSNCESCILELFKSKLLFEFETENKNLISKDMILKLNLFFSDFEKQFPDIPSQVKIIEEFKLLINEKLLVTNIDIGSSETLRFVLKLTNKKLTSLKSDELNFKISQNSRIKMPIDCKNVSDTLHDLLSSASTRQKPSDSSPSNIVENSADKSSVSIEKTQPPQITDKVEISKGNNTRSKSKAKPKTDAKSNTIPKN